MLVLHTFDWPVQLTQALPSLPHLLLPVPPMQAQLAGAPVWSQQPALQALPLPGSQPTVLHVLLPPASHHEAGELGQSATTTQPQCWLTQAAPLTSAPQLPQMAPPLPHELARLPTLQVPLL